MIWDKNRIIRLYLDGYKAVEIANIINEKPRTIQKILRDLKKTLSDKKIEIYETVHSNNKKLRSDERKENKKIMSDKNLALKNPSAYRANKNGDWVLNRNKQIYTNDMPLIIKNDGIRDYAKTFIKKKVI